MNHHVYARVLSAFCLAMAAGSALPALGQTPPPTARRLEAAPQDFRSARWLSDRKVVNDNHEDIATVSDLILERGTGRVEYLVVKTGTTLGMGGRAVAIPYASFRWEGAGDDRFVLGSTPEQLKLSPEFTTESWKAMKETKDDKNALRERLTSDSTTAGDPYSGNLDTAKKIRVEGEVKSVERVRTSTFGEQVEITVVTADGATRRIALGPSWYVNGSGSAPMRGDKVTVETLALPRDPGQLLAGTELRSGERQLALRDTSGTPAWMLKSVDSGGHAYSTPAGRYLLMSDLPGSKIDCRGSELGKVHDVIVDRVSGEIGFLSVDPNQNFLGIGDTKRLVPWSVAHVTLAGGLRLDASKEMVLASPETPKDPTTLNTGTFADRAYKAFDVPMPRFERARPVASDPKDSARAWAADGLVFSAIERDSDKTMEGTLVDTTDVTFTNGVTTARAVKVRVAAGDGGEETVLLGPVWYMDNQKLAMKNGDPVKVVACRTSIGGQRYWLARSVECKSVHVLLLDGTKAPAWSQP